MDSHKIGATGWPKGDLHVTNVSDISAPRASAILWRVVIGIVALILIAGGGAWLTHAGIDPSQEAQAASEASTSAPGSR